MLQTCSMCSKMLVIQHFIGGSHLTIYLPCQYIDTKIYIDVILSDHISEPKTEQ